MMSSGRFRTHALSYALASAASARRLLDSERPTCPPRTALRRHLARRAKRLWKRLEKHRPPRADGAIRSAYGVLLKDRSDDVTYQFCVKGTYGFFFANLLRRWRRPYVLLDVGANIGLYSLIAARSRNARRVVAFEPDPRSAELLRTNAALNDVAVDVVEAAVSATSGSALLAVPAAHSGASRLGAAEPGSLSLCVSTLAGAELDDAVGELPPGVDVIVKLDVEGHEFDALRGLRAWPNWKSVAAVWVELSEQTDRIACIDILRADGFDSSAWVGDGRHADVLFLRSRGPATSASHGAPRRLTRRHCRPPSEGSA